MAYTGYYTNQDLRNKLGNTIAANFEDALLEKARRHGDDFVDGETHKTSQYVDATDPNVLHAWKVGDIYFGRASGISMKVACAFVRSTQINVSIQEQREWNEACADVDRLYKDLVTAGLVHVSGRFAVDEFVTDVINPVSGTRVTGLRGIVPSRGRFYGADI